MDISVVIPVYGCPGALKELHDRLKNTFEKMNKSYEIILVNDHCPKNSIAVIEEICKLDSNTIGIDLSRNFGQQRAILAGLDNCSGDYVVVMDCDLQDRPEAIEDMYKKLEEGGFDVVFARSVNTKKKLTSKLFYYTFSKVAKMPYDPNLSNFSVAKRVVIENLCKMREMYRAYTSYILWMGFKVGYYDLQRDERKEGKSGYNFKKRLKIASQILLSQTNLPIKAIANSGIAISFLAFLTQIVLSITFGLLKMCSTLLYSSIFCCMFFCLGVLLTSVGIVGAYVSKTYNETKERPLYIIRDTFNKNK